MFLLWLAILILFWVAFYLFTQGAITRHIGFLHFLLFFLAIYLASYQVYEESGCVNNRFLGSVMAYPVLAFLGMAFGRIMGPETAFAAREVACLRGDRNLVILIIGGFLLIYAIYLRSLGSDVPLFILLRGGEPLASRVARYLATKGYEGEGAGGLRLFYWLPRILIDYFASFAIVFAYYWFHRARYGHLKLVIAFAGLVFLALLGVEKLPAVKLGVVLVLCHWNFNHIKLRLRNVFSALLIAVVGIFFIGIIYSIATGGMEHRSDNPILNMLILGWRALIFRIMLGQLQPLYVMFEIIPDHLDFFGGLTLTNPRGILPYDAVTLPYIIYDFYFKQDPGVQGSDPTAFFGEIYANWGLWISFLSMFLFGWLLQIINHVLISRIDDRGTAFDMAFFYMVSIYLADFAISFSTPYFDERIYFFVFLFFYYKHLKRRSIQGLKTTPPSEPVPKNT